MGNIITYLRNSFILQFLVVLSQYHKPSPEALCSGAGIKLHLSSLKAEKYVKSYFFLARWTKWAHCARSAPESDICMARILLVLSHMYWWGFSSVCELPTLCQNFKALFSQLIRYCKWHRSQPRLATQKVWDIAAGRYWITMRLLFKSPRSEREVLRDLVNVRLMTLFAYKIGRGAFSS